MKKIVSYTSILILISFLFTSCDLAEGIFKAGFGIGIFAVIAVLVVIVWIVRKFSKK
jgi:hypothetical protein